MTSLSENDQKNEINIDSKQCAFDTEQSALHNHHSKLITTTVLQETSDNDQKRKELNEKGSSYDSTHEMEDNKIIDGINNDDTLMSTSPAIVTTDEEQQKEATESTVNNDEDRSKKLFNSKVKYSSMPYPRPPYYINDHPYGSAPYYYHPPPPSIEKPTPLMFISTEQSPASEIPSSSSASRENQTGNSTGTSPQNLPPRLRQTSTTENESNLQTSSISSTSSQAPPPTTNGRRHRSILPRGNNNYYSPHPPPLMATPPGVLYTYPPAVHQSGHIAYNIRSSDELEVLAFQQHMMNLPPGSILWSPPPTGLPPHAHPHFPSYPMGGPPPPAYIFNNTTMTQSTNSFLNPEAAEWVPPRNDNDSSSDNQILIDDEINFPPLNSTTNNTQTTTTTANVNYPTDDDSEQTDSSSEITSTNNTDSNDPPSVSIDNSNISTQSSSKLDSTNISSSSQDDNNKPLSSSTIKVTPITYSTIISQTSENNKSNKTNIINQNQQRSHQQSTNHIHNQLPPRDRITKQRTQILSSNVNSRQRQPFNHNNRNIPRNLLSSEINSLPKSPPPQQQISPISDDWIEVKSKKTKKFDRILNDNSSEKLILDEQIPKSLSPPLSLTSTGDNTTTTLTSEDDFDDKDNHDLLNDGNQLIVDDIHRRLDNNERLLIIMRGCPGSGKSTLAKLINHGYHGVILSTDDYFTDKKLNIYTFDPSKLDDAHRYNRRRAFDAFIQDISPIIIDNTNTQVWEMKPYVAAGKEAGYDIILVEPQTSWRLNARELFKRNCHNLPIRRIREMLTRFEHNVTVQSIMDQISSNTKPNNFSSSEQQNLTKDQEIIDPISPPKKLYEIIDDALILDDVRLCINDMILFLTSSFYQTTTTSSSSQSSTPLSVSFHDLSLISPSTTTSLPSTPSTPHSRFHRPLTRFSPTTNQEHSFNTEHILRLPTTTFTRCIETNNLTPPLSAQSNSIGKKRRKNKNKQQANELLVNSNNNNNNMNDEQEKQQKQQTFNVFLPEDSSDFVVIDEQNDDNDWIDTVQRNFGIQINSSRDHSSTIPYQQKQFTHPKTCELLNIIHTELSKPAYHQCLSTKHIAIQCSPDDFHSQINHSDAILIGHLSSSSTESMATSSVPSRPGYNECGIQVDLNDNSIDALIRIYSDRLSTETIQQFYEVCHSDMQWTCIQLDQYLQENNEERFSIPTLRQLSLNKLNQWNEQIKSLNPSFDTKSINDLLEDINDEEILEEFTFDNTNMEYVNSNQINISWSIMNSLEEIYGELPDKSCFSANNNGIVLPFDDDLSINIYQALQRFLMKSNPIIKPVSENQIKKGKKKKINNDNQKWKLPTQNPSNSDINTNHIPSLRQIMNEEQQAAKSGKTKQTHQLDYATEHKLKELERHFPSFDSDLLYDIFRENEYDYDLTYICISTMFDEKASISSTHKSSQAIQSSRFNSTVKTTVEPVLDSYEILRCDALRHAQQRKEFYTKAHQANRHGMSGVVSFYIHRAGEETQLMKDANRAACERLSRWKLEQFYQTQRLDLHGLHSDEALNLFKQIEQELNDGNRRTTPKSIEIITGYGKNSVYGGSHGKIRSIILTYLQQRNYKYSEPNKGVILLQLTFVRN